MENNDNDDNSDPREDRRRSWHFDKSINTSNLIAVILAVGSLFIYQIKIDGSQDIRITLNSSKIDDIRSSAMVADQRTQEQLKEIKDGMVRIESWLRRENETRRQNR